MFMYLFSEDCPANIRKQFGPNKKCPIVYLFEDVEANVLYVGKTTNFCSRGSQHFRSDKPILQATKVRILVYKDYSEASFVEAQLIAKLQPEWNYHGKDEKVSKKKMKPACEFTLNVLTKRLKEFLTKEAAPVLVLEPIAEQVLTEQEIQVLQERHPNCTFKLEQITASEEQRYKRQKELAEAFNNDPVYLVNTQSKSTVAHMWSEGSNDTFCHMYSGRSMNKKNYRKIDHLDDYTVCKICKGVHQTYSACHTRTIEITSLESVEERLKRFVEQQAEIS